MKWPVILMIAFWVCVTTWLLKSHSPVPKDFQQEAKFALCDYSFIPDNSECGPSLSHVKSFLLDSGEACTRVTLAGRTGLRCEPSGSADLTTNQTP